MDELFDATDATGMADAIRSGEVAASEVVEHAARRVEERNPTINAITEERLDAAVAEAHGDVGDGPLAGVPFVVKDLGADVAGMGSTRGSRLFADVVAQRDSELVARYRRAGLIILGKTNTPELGKNATTEPLLHGPTRNPLDRSRSAGGSSGGSAAAVAAGMVPVGHGNDGGGSLRIPAAACGLVGLKPTRGRVPGQDRQGAIAAPTTVDHVVATSVRDSALLLDVAGGPLPGAGYAAPDHRGRWVDELDRAPGRRRVAVSTLRPDGTPAAPEVVGPVTATARRLEELGHEVVEAAPRFPTDDLAAGFAVSMLVPLVVDVDARLAELGRELADDDLEPFSHVLYEHARAMTSADVVRGLRAVERSGLALGAFFTDHDVLLTPTLAAPTPPLGHLDTTDLETVNDRAATYSAFTSFCNVTGQPAISLPLGQDAQGLPLGVQLVAGFGREALLLRLASQLLPDPH